MTQTVKTKRKTSDTGPQPGFQFTLESAAGRIEAVFNGVRVADSSQALLMRETRLKPVFYFPRADVRMDLLRRTGHFTHCPFKGNASHWTITAGGRTAENAAWSYDDPLPEATAIKDYIAFYADRVSVASEGEEGDEEARHSGDSGFADGNPLVEWLLREAWDTTTSKELVERLCRRIVAAGIPLSRVRLVLQTLHPQMFARSFSWLSSGDAVDEDHVPHDTLQRPEYLASPFAPILKGAGGVRRRLDIKYPQLDFPILEELKAGGATDYVAMPLKFTNELINVISITTDRPGGFTTEDLGQIYEILPVLSRLFEVHATRRTAVTLLDTYLGRHTGERVLKGLVKRGDGEDIHAVIWFSDLRGSTPLAESMPRKDFLEILNNYFDCMAGAVLDHGGEVLRFIGDAALAIFPTGENGTSGRKCCSSAVACASAMAATKDAMERMAALNSQRAERGEDPLGYGIGLHMGDLTYGNIGTLERLEFTVIGAAANEAARLEGLCKTLKKQVLFSAEFESCFSGELLSLGEHRLRGVGRPREIFTLRED